MKKIITILLVAMTTIVQAQFCETFDQHQPGTLQTSNNPSPVNNILDNWGAICGHLQYNNVDSQNGANDSYLRAVDSGCSTTSSWIYNSTDYTGDWSQFDDCFCYDMNIVRNGTSNQIPTSSLRIYDGTNPQNSTNIATFVLNNAIGINDGWVRICAPLGMANADGTLPSNATGTWVINNGGSWNNLVTNVQGIAYLLDIGTGGEEYYFDNICVTEGCNDSFTIEDKTEYCCGTDNLVENGNFESGNTGFTSDYTYESNIAPSSILPSMYGITDNAGALTVSPNWNVEDHTKCINGTNDNFLVVNGKTTQTPGTQSVIWSQSISGMELEEHKICANFKNMPQCTFDVKPVITIEVNGTQIYNGTIDTASDPCDWQLVSSCYRFRDDFATVRILLDEDSLGDGNDLAIDDISIQTLEDPLLNISVQHTSDPKEIIASVNTIDPSDDQLANEKCAEIPYYWFVFETNTVSPLSIVPGTFGWGNTTGNNTPSNGWDPINTWDLSTNFPNYTFDDYKLYAIGMYTPSCCEDGCIDAGWTYQLTFNAPNARTTGESGLTPELKEEILKLFVRTKVEDSETIEPVLEIPTLEEPTIETKKEQLNIYPVPATNQLNVVIKQPTEGYTISDLNGAIVLKEQVYEIKTIDISSLTSGIYFLNVITKNGESINKKFIKK